MAPAACAFFTCTVPSYLAPMGQMGTHDELPQQGGRPSRGTLFRACGVELTSSPIVAAPFLNTLSMYERGMGGMGYGVDLGDPSSGTSSPDTPMAYSALPYQGSNSLYEMGQSTPVPNWVFMRKSLGSRRIAVPSQCQVAPPTRRS